MAEMIASSLLAFVNWIERKEARKRIESASFLFQCPRSPEWSSVVVRRSTRLEVDFFFPTRKKFSCSYSLFSSASPFSVISFANPNKQATQVSIHRFM